jgi:hypothetical protein
MSSSSRPPALLEYLIEQDFVPQAEGTWLDHGTGDGIIRVVREPGEPTVLICLAPSGACLYQAAFSMGTPDAVIIAAAEAALRPPQPQPGRRRPRRPRSGRARSKKASGDPR